jgi:dipeptidyl-peptidase-4
MTESFPRQQARTRRFTLGVPRAFAVSPAGDRITFLRSRGGSDPLTCLWLFDVASGTERLIADPAVLGAADDDLPPEEKRRRERVREQAGGIVSYAVDAAVRTAVFSLAGRVFAVDLVTGEADAANGAGGPAGANGAGGPAGAGSGTAGPRELPLRGPALDPRPAPDGRRVAYVHAGTLRVASLDGAPGEDRSVAGPADTPGVSFGLAEFIAAEEMGRSRGYWWAPDGTALLVARVDETPVMRWHIADPANPERSPAEVAYPAAGTPNADVSLILVDLAGRSAPVGWDRAAFPYLVTVCWDGQDGSPDPLIVVQSRDQRRMQILVADRATGTTSLLWEDTDPHWVDIVPGVPAWTADGRIVWTVTRDDARRLVVATPGELSGGRAEPVTPAGLQVREVLGVDSGTVLFTASDEPTRIGLWSYGPDGVRQVSDGAGVFAGRRAGGTTVITGRSLAEDGATVRVLRPGPAGAAGDQPVERRIACYDEPPNLPAPRPAMLSLGPRQIRAALLFPSWHQPGSGPLPVLLDPYGGPHSQRVLAARGAYVASQWFAEQGFAVLVADGRGTPGRGPAWDRAVAGDLADPVLQDQVDALHAAAEQFGDLDLSRVAIRGWSFGGYLSALAVLRRPDVFHAAVAGAPVTDYRLYDTHYTERYLGQPDSEAVAYDNCSPVRDAERLQRDGRPGGQGAGTAAPGPGGPGGPDGPGKEPFRPMMIIHGLADDNVVVAHTLRLSSALLAAGYPHTVLPLSGVTHMTPQEVVAENLLLLQLDFLRQSLGEGQG